MQSTFRVTAVVPTFNPDIGFIERLNRLGNQVDHVMIVDDGGGKQSEYILEKVFGKKYTVIRLEKNCGIATALNVGMRRGLAMGAEYLVNVDQDTLLPNNYIETALEIFSRSHPVTRIGIVCVDQVNSEPALPTWISPEGFGLVPEAIQTGFVISAECLNECGFLDERLVIDCVDTEFCMRVRASGFNIAIAKNTNVEHTIGRLAPLQPFGVQLKEEDGSQRMFQYHSPFRRYYITRNNIDLCLRYLRTQPRWTAVVIRRQAKGMLYSATSGPRCGAQSLAILVGTVHGLMRRRGRIPPWLEKLIL